MDLQKELKPRLVSFRWGDLVGFRVKCSVARGRKEEIKPKALAGSWQNARDGVKPSEKTRCTFDRGTVSCRCIEQTWRLKGNSTVLFQWKQTSSLYFPTKWKKERQQKYKTGEQTNAFRDKHHGCFCLTGERRKRFSLKNSTVHEFPGSNQQKDRLSCRRVGQFSEVSSVKSELSDLKSVQDADFRFD